MSRLATIRALAIVHLAIVPFVGCSDGAADDVHEEPGAYDSLKADSVDYDNWTYFIVTRPDMRRCISPICGGVYVKRVNQPEVKCADGKWAKECYVGGFDFGALGYSSEEQVEAYAAIASGHAVFRGAIVTGFFAGDHASVPAFAASEVWVAASDKKPANTFFRAHDAGIMCITSPCASIDGLKVNKNAHPSARYAGLDLAPLGLDETQTAAAWDALRTGHLLVAGKAVKVTGPGGQAEGLKANQIYFPKVAAPVEDPSGPVDQNGDDPVLGKACGGRAGACPDGYYCQFADALCGKADGQGGCAALPTSCDDNDEPVCGCDGVTYSNDCYRKLAGAGHGEAGECKTDAVCQIGGCSGELCIAADSGSGISVCLWKDAYACYQQLGVCETQGDGSCGWTPTDDLTSCLDHAGQ